MSILDSLPFPVLWMLPLSL